MKERKIIKANLWCRGEQEGDEKKRNCWHKLCFELFLNNKLRIYVLVGEGFMTNLFFYYGAVSPLAEDFYVRE